MGNNTNKKPDVCQVDGCNSANVVARGWCNRHYQRWQKHGDPLWTKEGDRPEKPTTAAHEWCYGHQDWHPTVDFGRNARKVNGLAGSCRSLENARSYRWAAENPDKILEQAKRRVRLPATAQQREQKRLYRLNHLEIVSRGIRRWNTEHKEERRAYAKEYNAAHRAERNAHSSLRRARMRKAVSEKFLHEEIFERDDWICGLCGGEIDQDLQYPDPWSVTLDHIWPISLGGPHLRCNAQTAHARCNISKKDKMDPVVARYFW